MGHILFLCTEGFDTPGPSNHLIGSLIEDLLDSGFKITLIQSRRERIYPELPDSLVGKPNLRTITIDRKVIPKQSFIRRYFEEVVYALRCWRNWKELSDVDAVFVQSCPTVLVPILLVKWSIRKPVLYSIQDMWPGSAVNSGVLAKGFVSKVFYSLQKIAYKHSDILTVISEDMKLKVIEQGVSEEKIHTIVNWFDDRELREVSWAENRFVKKYGLSNDKFYVQYAGTMGYVFDYEMVLAVAEQLIDYEDIEFHMIGRGSNKDVFVAETEKRGLTNIRFFPLEPQNMVSDVYSACSVCLIPLKKGIIGNSVPSKAGLVMACNRAIVNSVDGSSDYYKTFNEKQIGISISNDNYNSVADAILDLYSNSEKRKLYAKNGHEFGKKYYSRSVNTEKFIELFRQIPSKRLEGG